MIRLKREIKILTLFLTIAYGVWAEAQMMGAVSATEVPRDVTTVNPMDPINDSRRAADSQMLDIRRRKAAGPVSGTIEPREIPQGY